MPPEDAKQPDPEKRKAFVTSLASTFVASEKRQMAGEGRRDSAADESLRISRTPCATCWACRTAQIANQLPQDGEAYRFNKSAEALDVSFLTMQRFMSAADFAMRQAMAQKLDAAGEDDHEALCPRRALADTVLSAQRERHAAATGFRSPCWIRMRSRTSGSDARRVDAARTREREAVGKVVQHLQRFRRYGWSFRARGHRPLSRAARRLHDLGRRRRDRPLVL